MFSIGSFQESNEGGLLGVKVTCYLDGLEVKISIGTLTAVESLGGPCETSDTQENNLFISFCT